MPPRLSDDVRLQIELELQMGNDPGNIAGWYDITASQVRKMRGNLLAFGTVAPNPGDFYKQGAPMKVTKEIEEDVIEFIEDNKTALLDEVKEFLLEE